MSNLYLVLGETEHGKRYWAAGQDPDACMDRSHRRVVYGPAEVGPHGYPNDEEAIDALATYSPANPIDLNDPATWPLETEETQ